MILDTISESEFRSDPNAVSALKEFLGTPHGQKFAAALRGGDPMNTLCSATGMETANPNNLLGVAKGYRLALSLIDELAKGALPKKDSQYSHATRVNSILQQGPKQ